MNRIDFMLPGTIEWTLADLELPEAGTAVIAYGLNAHGKGRRMRAFYAPKFTIEDDNEYEAAEYCEEQDQYFLREGWYETNEHEDVHWMIDFPVTHWMPLPAAPFSEEHLRAVRAHIPFMPTVRQARYADWDCILTVKNGERFFTEDFLKKFHVKNIAKLTTSDIGNMAYIFLRSKYTNERTQASLDLYLLRDIHNDLLTDQEDHLLDTFGAQGMSDRPLPFLKK